MEMEIVEEGEVSSSGFYCAGMCRQFQPALLRMTSRVGAAEHLSRGSNLAGNGITEVPNNLIPSLRSWILVYAVMQSLKRTKVCLKGLTICIDAMFKFFNDKVCKFFANGNWISIRRNNWWQDIEDLCGSFFERPGQKVCSHWWLLICIVLKKQTYPWRHRHNQIHLAQFLYLIIELLFCRKTLKHPSLFPVSSDIYPWASRTDRVKYWILFYGFLFCFSFHLISLCFKNCYFFM